MYIPIISSVIDGISSYVSHKQELKKINREGELEIAKAKNQSEIELVKSGQEITSNEDSKSIDGMQFTWKDEYFALIFTMPFIGSFIPVAQDYVAIGWSYITSAPEWYTWLLIGMIIATFGLKGIFKWVLNKKVKL